jgi:hypothetical protein
MVQGGLVCFLAIWRGVGGDVEEGLHHVATFGQVVPQSDQVNLPPHAAQGMQRVVVVYEDGHAFVGQDVGHGVHRSPPCVMFASAQSRSILVTKWGDNEPGKTTVGAAAV